MSEPARPPSFVSDLTSNVGSIRHVPSYREVVEEPPPSAKPTVSTIESRWGIGWRTPATMAFFYIIALLTALAHLLFFLELDGKRTDANSVPPQTYVTVISTLLVNIFGASLTVALGVACTQYLWRLFRTRPMSVKTVEALYGIRKGPASLLVWSTWTVAPVLCVLALLTLLVSLAKSFPPGALTVVVRNPSNVSDGVVPTFDPDYIGNGSLDAAWAHSLCYFVFSNVWVCENYHPAAARISYATLSTGDILASTSPCGTNCSYSITFDGPYLTCDDSSDTTEYPAMSSQDNMDTFQYYTAGYLQGDVPSEIPNITAWDSGLPSEVSWPVFSMSQSTVLGLSIDNNNPVCSIRTMECQPEIASYNVTVSFENGVRTISYNTSDIRQFNDLYTPEALLPRTINPDNNPIPSNWTQDQLGNLKALNIWAILDSTLQPLLGDYEMFVVGLNGANKTVSLSNETSIEVKPGEAVFSLPEMGAIQPNNTIVEMTYFNKNRDSLNVVQVPDINMTSSMLSDALANVTISIFLTLPLWNTTTNVTYSAAHTYYSFSSPSHLYLPYGLSLVVALPCLGIGIVALIRNGVPAMDRSFVQVLMTTSASRKLAKAAAGGGLGGERNVPQELNKMRVMFGELPKAGEELLSIEETVGGEVVRAGFGMEDEVVPLRKRARYGVVTETLD